MKTAIPILCIGAAAAGALALGAAALGAVAVGGVAVCCLRSSRRSQPAATAQSDGAKSK